MWLQQPLLSMTCAFVITSAHPLALPQSDATSETGPSRHLDHNENPEGFPKHFHEPGYSMIGAHYDSRYFKAENTYEERRQIQVHMLRAYFQFFSETSMETWIAHGTLLGWWWNGKMLPWDRDIDTQVSDATLRYMGAHHNMTMYDYVAADHLTWQRTYLLDVNPAIHERERGNGNNIIDARFIDTTTGLYIDITGLSETHPEDQPGIWSCKNYHRYYTTDLYPMRETVFEGVTAKVPYAYDRLLTTEYTGKALVVTEYEGHRWVSSQKEWVKKSDEEIQADKDALQRAKQLKQNLQKQRMKAEKLRQKYEAAKQEKLMQEEAIKQEKVQQGEDAKQALDKLEETNKQEAAKLAKAIKEEKEPRKDMQPEPAQTDATPPYNPPQAEASPPEPHV